MVLQRHSWIPCKKPSTLSEGHRTWEGFTTNPKEKLASRNSGIVYSLCLPLKQIGTDCSYPTTEFGQSWRTPILPIIHTSTMLWITDCYFTYLLSLFLIFWKFLCDNLCYRVQFYILELIAELNFNFFIIWLSLRESLIKLKHVCLNARDK